ncbi:flagellar hook-associated protein FlgK [Aliihoeflea sp. PC F10.4]
MSLSSVLYTAQSSLANTSRQTSVISRNITNVYNTDYTRRDAALISTAPGARIVSITRAADAALMRQNTNALSAWHAQSTLMAGFDRLSVSVNGVDNATSPAMRMGALQTALQTFSASPGDRNLAQGAVNAAGDVVRSLNEGSAAIQKLRTDADLEIKQSADRLNTLLADLEKTNGDVVTATRLKRDASEALDQRDAIVKQIAELVPVTTHVRGDNEMVVFSRDGITLFETVAREVTFEPTPIHAPGTVGNGVFIGGIELVSGNGSDTDGGGSLGALMQLRDEIAPTLQMQLDEIARGLIAGFSEEQGGDAAGLFTWSGNADQIPGGPVEGLAGLIQVNTAYRDNPLALRDGVAGAANPDGHAGYTGQIQRFIDMFSATGSFDPDTGITGAASLSDFATGSISWLEDGRKLSSVAGEKKAAMLARTSEALSNKTGVNIDEELARLLDLEQSYAASAKLLQVANEMLATLMATVR